MFYNTAILSVLVASTSMVSVSLAAPVNARQSPSCPAGTSYFDYESTSGFKGCTATPAEYQNGPRKYWGICPTGHGNWYVCANGFKGCTTDSTICDTKPSGWVPPVLPPVAPKDSCPSGQAYYVCATGFKGCSSDTSVCDPKPPVEPSTCPSGQSYYVCANGFKGCSADTSVCDPKKPESEPVEPGSCPSGENYYVCANGFKGCSADTTVCDSKPKGSEKVEPEVVNPSTGNSKFCPSGTSYYDYESTSGFKGCTSAPAAYQNAPRVYWGSCPTGHGNWYVCANGFKGCNTNSAVCDLKV
ncbi:hypothetical protein ONS95_011122 [Cadophora gregata]|uniref:uncharacterized protein n=1 Tax=Cadophora gregata TaxID=51156 RepID=UPI0026DB880E|nr:uncharacterized protein ONS95_011122 [Cadophora gregata]KAK0119686.1 hypothetical protein ONS95_011122 [Cadophora gregata]KAK0120721.1 hypothetical protein ONS96_010924 [Cadophora gregata f. sp. sojae]